MFGSTPGTVLITYALVLLIASVVISLTSKSMFEVDEEEREG